MLTEPEGVKQDMGLPGKQDLRPISQANWRMFSTKADAEAILKTVQELAPDAQLVDASKKMYAPFVYASPEPDIMARIVYGTVDHLTVQEFAGDLVDRQSKPNPFVDRFAPGQPRVLRCQPVGAGLGQLYWAADERGQTT